jgi:hypothetical protein
VFYPSRGEAVGQVIDLEEIKSERFLFCNLCNIIDPMRMHILAHLYFEDLMRRVFCISDMFVIQNKHIARNVGAHTLWKLVSDRQGRPITCSCSHGYTASQYHRKVLSWMGRLTESSSRGQTLLY